MRVLSRAQGAGSGRRDHPPLYSTARATAVSHAPVRAPPSGSGVERDSGGSGESSPEPPFIFAFAFYLELVLYIDH